MAPQPPRERVEELRAVLDALPFATAVRDRDGRFLYANAAAAGGYGVPHEAMIGKTDLDLLPGGNDGQEVLAMDRQAIDTGRSITVPGQRFVTHEGRRLVLHVTREPVRFLGTAAVLITALDVTDAVGPVAERRLLEDRMVASQRLAALGLMAAGVAPATPVLQPRRVLVVDDEASVRDVTCALLEAHGFQAQSAAHGQAALDVAKSQGPFAAVVLDMSMPGLSVTETHQGLRAALGDRVPILLTSGYTEPDLLAALCALPGTAFLEKPFDIESLVKRLNSLLG